MKLENNYVTFEVSNHAAEIHSFKLKDNGFEAMWNGNPEYWAGRNPILFPIIGSTYDKIIHIDGKEYFMGNHGLLRNAEFETEEVTEDSITLSFTSTEETLKQYPYEFKLSVTYTLVDNKVVVSYYIENLSDKVMPFSFGLHPAFNCPLDPSKKFNDYRLEFACVETSLANIEGSDGKSLPLSYEIFEKTPSMSFEYLKSPYVTLTDGNHGIKVSCAGYRWLVFWTPPHKQAPFICIEPWHGHGDRGETKCEFKDREGTYLLEPNHSYTTEYTIELF